MSSPSSPPLDAAAAASRASALSRLRERVQGRPSMSPVSLASGLAGGDGATFVGTAAFGSGGSRGGEWVFFLLLYGCFVCSWVPGGLLLLGVTALVSGWVVRPPR